MRVTVQRYVCMTVPRCVCVCDIVLIVVLCGTLIILLPSDKQNKYVILTSLLFYDEVTIVLYL